MHICVGNLTIIVSGNGLSPGRRQAIIWTNAEIVLIRHLGMNLGEILIEIQTFSFKKTLLKVSSAKWRLFCLGLIVLNALLKPSQCVLETDKFPSRWQISTFEINRNQANPYSVAANKIIPSIPIIYRLHNGNKWVSIFTHFINIPLPFDAHRPTFIYSNPLTAYLHSTTEKYKLILH